MFLSKSLYETNRSVVVIIPSLIGAVSHNAQCHYNGIKLNNMNIFDQKLILSTSQVLEAFYKLSTKDLVFTTSEQSFHEKNFLFILRIKYCLLPLLDQADLSRDKYIQAGKITMATIDVGRIWCYIYSVKIDSDPNQKYSNHGIKDPF